mmetsp:Transcript_25351/g.46027  ORF Transcript_25351/g.46027 Transcript_25351/m.46027 type:complete len:202 (-) Transcript_25351:194-799(-)
METLPARVLTLLLFLMIASVKQGACYSAVGASSKMANNLRVSRPSTKLFFYRSPKIVSQSHSLAIKNHYKPIKPFNTFDPRVARLHLSARKAIKAGHDEKAKMFYQTILYNWQGNITAASALPQTYLLLALLEQKRKNIAGARAVFLEATTMFPDSAKLKQAHALFESKFGERRYARRLAEEAVAIDPSLFMLLEWKVFQC